MKQSIRDLSKQIRAAIANGARPKTILASNVKTGFSVFDNVPQITCAHVCPVADKCYDIKILNLRPNVLTARLWRHWFLALDPVGYVRQLSAEIAKKRKRPSKIRVYAGGDFTPAHVQPIERLCRSFPDITFYMISKTIRSWPSFAARLLRTPNFFLNLSEMADYRFGPEWDSLRAHPRVNTVYTLRPEETDFRIAARSDIIFNVTKAKKAIATYKANRLPLCPCDAKDIPSRGACESCGLCATKGGVKGDR